MFPLKVEKLFDTPYKQKFERGDVVRSVNGIVIENDLNEFLSFAENSFSKEFFTYVVERNGRLVTLKNVVQSPPRVSQVLPKSSAIIAGLKKGDFILSINSEKISNFNQIKNAVEQYKGGVLRIEYWRKGLVYETDWKRLIVDVSTALFLSSVAEDPATSSETLVCMPRSATNVDTLPYSQVQ